MSVNIILKTIKGGEITPQDDAIIYQATVQSGIFDGCEVSASNNNTLNITGGFGMIAGRYFRMRDSSIDVTLPLSENLKGRLYFHLDLQNTDDPLKLLVATGASLAELKTDERVNITEGVYQMALATFDATPLGIVKLEQVRGGMMSLSKELAENYRSLVTANEQKKQELIAANNENTTKITAELQKIYEEQAAINQKLTGPFKATVTYHVDIGNEIHKEILQGNDAIKDAPVVTKPGWDFMGWAETNKAKASIVEGWAITVTEALTFYAVFKQTGSTRVNFDPDGGQGNIKEITAEYTATYNNGNEDVIGETKLPTTGFTKGGNILIGWRDLTFGHNATYDLGDKAAFSEETTLYAQWLKANSATAFGLANRPVKYTAPASGVYKLEVWGAEGGYNERGTPGAGGLGGHAYGYTVLKKGDVVYVCVGGGFDAPNKSWKRDGGSGGGGTGNAGRGSTAVNIELVTYSNFGQGDGGTSTGGGGYNGGGTVKSSSASYRSGGGCTHIARINGTLAEIGITRKDQVLIVAGGGGSASNGNNGGGGGGGYCGGNGGNGLGSGGGCGYIGGVPEFAADRERYAPFQENDKQSGNGKAEITFIKFYKRGLR